MKKLATLGLLAIAMISCSGKNEELQKQLEAEKAKTAAAEKMAMEQSAAATAAQNQKTIDSLKQVTAKKTEAPVDEEIANIKNLIAINSHWKGNALEIKFMNKSAHTLISNMKFKVTLFNGNGSVKSTVNIVKNDNIYPGGELNFHEDINEPMKCRVELASAKYTSTK